MGIKKPLRKIRERIEYKIAQFLFSEELDGEKVLLLLNDKLGDAVLRLKLLHKYLLYFRERLVIMASNINYPLYKLLVNEAQIITFNHSNFMNPLQRWNIIRRLSSFDIGTVVNPLSSRPIYVDYFIRDLKIKNKIGYEGQFDCYIDHSFDKFYTRLVPSVDRNFNWKEKLPHFLTHELKVYNSVTGSNLSFHDIILHEEDVWKIFGIRKHKDLCNPYIIICLGAGSYKRIFPLQKWARIIEYLLNTYRTYRIIFVGSRKEMFLYEQLKKNLSSFEEESIVNLIGKTTIYELISVIAKASLYIGNDTGVSNLSSMLRVPTIVIYPLAEYGKFMNDFIPSTYYIYSEKYLTCKICGWECIHSFKEGIFPCVYDVSIDEIINRIDYILRC